MGIDFRMAATSAEVNKYIEHVQWDGPRVRVRRAVALTQPRKPRSNFHVPASDQESRGGDGSENLSASSRIQEDMQKEPPPRQYVPR
jgi:hypothetical protein